MEHGSDQRLTGKGDDPVLHRTNSIPGPDIGGRLPGNEANLPFAGDHVIYTGAPSRTDGPRGARTNLNVISDLTDTNCL
ncbi:hypothetical protein GWI33_010127 [Rhynchophorus ferrugineus]|uniref:Uncharacterized protein n=1 Tax=Rhynchophorus ferrugineus TaxID=354439 RepID=A0A834IR24_RHYFE|nr:hypothetical protein GWI33_010127 [Rhynchophorus ferrugineus]